jgi:hypothetical protein
MVEYINYIAIFILGAFLYIPRRKCDSLPDAAVLHATAEDHLDLLRCDAQKFDDAVLIADDEVAST